MTTSSLVLFATQQPIGWYFPGSMFEHIWFLIESSLQSPPASFLVYSASPPISMSQTLPNLSKLTCGCCFHFPRKIEHLKSGVSSLNLWGCEEAQGNDRTGQPGMSLTMPWLRYLTAATCRYDLWMTYEIRWNLRTFPYRSQIHWMKKSTTC